MIDGMHNDRFVIANLPRQSGKSKIVISYLLHYVLFNSQKNVAILANKLATARELLSRLKLAYEHLPKWLQQGVVEWNKGSIILENGSKILASSTSASSIRGGSFSLVYLDEFAFENANNVATSPILKPNAAFGLIPNISRAMDVNIVEWNTPLRNISTVRCTNFSSACFI